MALDSGLSWFSQAASPELQSAVDSIAYSENIPLILTRANLPRTAKAILEELEGRTLFGSLFTDKTISKFFEFLDRCSGSSPQIDDLFRELSLSIFSTRYSYANPFFRLLSDHRFYRWFFALQMARFASDNSPARQEEHHLIDLGLPFVFLKTPVIYSDYLLIVGPIWIDNHDASEREISNNVKALNSKLFSAWLKHVERNAMVVSSTPYALYSNEFLYRFMFSRQRASKIGIADRVHQVAALAQSILPHSSELFQQFPKHSISKFVGAASCLLETYNLRPQSQKLSVPIQLSIIDRTAIIPDRRYDLSFDGKALTVESKPGNANDIPEIDASFDHKKDDHFTTWQAYIYESFVILRNWLANYFGLQSEDKESGVFGSNDRLARFLCQVFHCDEATLYSINYEEDGLPLMKFASFTDDVDPQEKLKAIYQHMLSIAADTAKRRKSISYRALDCNQLQYVKHYDFRRSDQRDEECISFPQNTKWTKWGASAIAIPVRVYGVTWGALELISFRADNFPITVRMKVEEVATIISSSLFLQSILRTIAEITDIVHREEGSEARVSKTCVKLRSLLLADSILIVLDDGRSVRFVGQSGRPDIEEAEARRFDESRRYLAPFQAFAQSGDDIWSGRIGSKSFNELFKAVKGRKFYTARKEKHIILKKLGKSDGKNDKRFIVCFTFPFEVLDDERWRYTLGIIFDFVSSVIDSLFAEVLWEREVRRKIGHELRRLTRTLSSSVSKVDGIGGIKGLWLYDIKTATEGIGAYSGVLEDSYHQPKAGKDPRLLVVEKLTAAYRGNPIDVRGYFNSAFQARNVEATRNDLKLGVLPQIRLSKVRMDGFLLYEVFGSLADNVYKYAPKDSEVYVWAQELNDALHLNVANVGPELDPDEQYKIFDEGYRGELAKAASDSGSGFGLSYARTIMRGFSGDLYYLQHMFWEGGRWTAPAGIDSPRSSWHQFTVAFHGSTLGE